MDTPVPAPGLRPDTPGIDESNLRTEIEVVSSTVIEDPYREPGEQEEWLERWWSDAFTVSVLLGCLKLYIEIYLLLSELLTSMTLVYLTCYRVFVQSYHLGILHCYLVQ